MNQNSASFQRLKSLILTGVEPGDSSEVKLQKSLLLASSIMIILAGLLWGYVYIAFDEPLAGVLPISYSALSLLSITIYLLTHNYPLFRTIQLLLILIIPFLLQLALGGFVNSSAVVLWSLLCPLGALMFGQRRHAIGWFLAFIGAVTIGGIAQPDSHLINNLPDWLTHTFYIANISAISSIAFFMLYHFVRQKQKLLSLLEEQAVTDALTGLYNRTLLTDCLDNAVYQSKRTNVNMTLLTLDIDYFKQVNDSKGHDAGDMVLRYIGDLLINSFSQPDKSFRLGGEEFIVVLHNRHQAQGVKKAEELRTAIESHTFFSDRRVTASIGVATLQPDETWQAWMKRCDNNLYRAKSNGRNQVVAAGTVTPFESTNPA